MPSGTVEVSGICSRNWSGTEDEEYQYQNEWEQSTAREQARERAGDRLIDKHRRECGCDTLQLSAR